LWNQRLMLSAVVESRIQVLDLTAGKSDYDSGAVAEIAARQGGLITEFIIWKETLKAEIRTVLDEDQMAFVEELVQLIIQQRIQKVFQ
ncbi:MAG: hypothetical protein ACWA5R_03145, partial [bacterium]